MTCDTVVFFSVSMKSGLEDRNNADNIAYLVTTRYVSMKSGLEDRNNLGVVGLARHTGRSLNEVRPGRPEQFNIVYGLTAAHFESQ